ncbi:MAG: BON domain-containing protein, partial [Pseudomonadota bacterium]
MRSDDIIKSDILAEIDWDPEIESTEIGVTVDKGAVSLYGKVSSYVEQLAAERAAKRVKGVKSVAEEIKIDYPSDWHVSDEDIAERIAKLFDWHHAFRTDEIKAVVRDGFVTLSGTVDWNYQRNAARREVAGVRGVTGVSNQITLRPHASAKDVKQKINAALHRNANLEASHVNIDVRGGKVTLTGDVKAWY